MENNKYYTPEIEEFHVGFEFEYLASPRIETNNGYIKDVLIVVQQNINLFVIIVGLKSNLNGM